MPDPRVASISEERFDGCDLGQAMGEPHGVFGPARAYGLDDYRKE